MARFSIIGTGTMANAIGDRLSTGGAEVTYVTRGPVGIAPLGEVVVLAVPYPAVASIADAYRDELAGKVVVDVTNPVDFATLDGLVVPADGSAAAGLQAALPESQVLKAFNTNFASTLRTGKTGDATTTVLIAGDDLAAKQTLAAAVEAAGLVAGDAGSLKRARELEATGFLQIALSVAAVVTSQGGFAVV